MNLSCYLASLIGRKLNFWSLNSILLVSLGLEKRHKTTKIYVWFSFYILCIEKANSVHIQIVSGIFVSCLVGFRSTLLFLWEPAAVNYKTILSVQMAETQKRASSTVKAKENNSLLGIYHSFWVPTRALTFLYH